MSSEAKYPAYFDHIFKFQQYMSDGKSTHIGTIGLKKPALYICRRKLKSYWTEQRIKDILDDLPGCENITIDEIRSHYLITFSVLCYISKVDMHAVPFIKSFVQDQRNDHLLPSANWANEKSPGLKGTLDAFIIHQWTFIPYELSDQVRFREEINHQIILPFEQSDLCKLREYSHSQSQIYSVKIKSCCAEINKSTVVLKIVENESKDEWDREKTIYSRLLRNQDKSTGFNPFQYIVEFLGAFSQPQEESSDPASITPRISYTIILEQISGGGLDNFFQDKKDRIVSHEDRQNLWQHMFDLLQGIHLMHNLGGGWRATHQDINWENILHTESPLEDLGKALFKLVDFGKAHLFNPEGRKAQAAALSNTGTRAFMAPEVCKLQPAEYSAKPEYHPEADIWALGCLFSDILIWTALGSQGLDEYRELRKDEIKKDRLIVDAGHQGGFHNGTSRLQAVDQMHAKALSHFSLGDCSHIASEIILNSMLREADSRERNVMILRRTWCQKVSAVSTTEDSTIETGLSPPLLQKKEEIIERAIASSGGSEAHETASPHGLIRADSLTNPFGPAVTISDIFKHMSENRGHIDQRQFKTVAATVDSLGNTSRNGRSQMFLVDDSNSMKFHQDDVTIAIRVLSKLIKSIVPRNERMTLQFASNQKKSFAHAKSSRLARIVETKEFCDDLVPLGQHIISNLENIFKAIREDVVALSLKPKSIYVLTDGLWKTNDRETDIQTPIMRLMDQMMEAKADMKDISITIIRFTSTTPGQRRPERSGYIDFNDLVVRLRQHKGMSNNLVTVSRFDNGDIHQMLMGRIREGSIRRVEDDNGQSQSRSRRHSSQHVQRAPGPPGPPPPGPPPSY